MVRSRGTLLGTAGHGDENSVRAHFLNLLSQFKILMVSFLLNLGIQEVLLHIKWTVPVPNCFQNSPDSTAKLAFLHIFWKSVKCMNHSICLKTEVSILCLTY